jgi:hypothetical protein
MRWKSFAVKKVSVIMAARWDDDCDLASPAASPSTAVANSLRK